MHSKTKRLGFWLSLISVGGDIQPRLVTVLTPATYRHCVAFQPKLRFVNARKLVDFTSLHSANSRTHSFPYKITKSVLVPHIRGIIPSYVALFNPVIFLMKQVSPLRAVAHGHLTVTLPVVGIIAFCGFIGWLLNGVGALFVGLIVGSVIAWPFWSFLMPRWRDWVEDSGLTGDDVQRLAVLTFLLWPKGSLFERTEFK